MFRCKFCGNEKPPVEESSAHHGLCKKCYTNILKYRREITKPFNNRDNGFIQQIEKICSSNLAAQRYVPKDYTEGRDLTGQCKTCGSVGKMNASSKQVCNDCHRLYGKYRLYTLRLDKGQNCGSKVVDFIATCEKFYAEQLIKGFAVPEIYKRKGLGKHKR